MNFKHTALLGALFIGAALTSAQAEIVIGVVGPMTGSSASIGEQFRRGAEQAVQNINAAGGINGEMLRLEVGDDACDPKQAVAVANQMASLGVKFVAGHYCSGSSIPASQVYTEEGILQISPGSTNPVLTDDGGDNVFRVCGRDDQQGLLAGAYVAKNYAGQRIALIHDKSAYGKGLVDQTRKTMHQNNAREKMYEAYSAGQQDYSALITKLKQANITVVYIGGYHTDAAAISRQMRDQGLKATLIGGDALMTDEFWSITGPAGEGTLMTFGADPRSRPESAAVMAEFRKAGYEPEGYTLYTYAAVQVFADAVRKAGSTDLSALVQALRDNAFDTVMGPIDFDENGDVTAPGFVMYRWHDGKYAEVPGSGQLIQSPEPQKISALD